MTKRKLRFFCDYCVESPLWESAAEDVWPEDEYNKSSEILRNLGVSEYTLHLMDTLQYIYEYPPSDEELSVEENNAFYALQMLILKRLGEEIGDRFEIEVL